MVIISIIVYFLLTYYLCNMIYSIITYFVLHHYFKKGYSYIVNDNICDNKFNRKEL